MSSGSSALHLARHLEIVDYKLPAQGRTTKSEDLATAVGMMFNMIEEAKAEFCALYLPSLVRAYISASNKNITSLISKCTIFLLHALIEQPIFKGHFLRCCPDAKDLVLTLTSEFVLWSEGSFLDENDNLKTRMMAASMYLQVIQQIILSVLYHGSISPVNLVLPPSLGRSLLTVCQNLLLHADKLPPFATASHGHPSELKKQLEMVPRMLLVEGAGNSADLTKFRREVGQADGVVFCELRKEGRGCSELERGISQEVKLSFCGICKSVAYCSQEHQRADWKKHKAFCFRPTW